ncbi:MAG: DMT family transporter [Peptostreptococcaceae bacterium]|nr:DMT family transporter [Peptostreptococcaceae bacterium]
MVLLVNNEKNKGIIFMLAAAVSFAMMFVMIKFSGDLPTVQKAFFRNIVAFIFAIILLRNNGEKIELSKKAVRDLILRSVFGLTAVLCNFYAVDHLILADANMLTNTNPFFAILISYFLLKEKIKPYQIVAIVVAFIGCMFVIKPSFQISDFGDSLIGLCGGILAGAAYAWLRKLGAHKVPANFVVAFFSGFSCIAILPFMIFGYSHMTVNQLIILLIAGVFASFGQFFVTNAYYHAPAKEISVYMYTQVLFAAVLGFIVFDQVPDKYSVTGYLIVISMGIFMFFKKKNEIQKDII